MAYDTQAQPGGADEMARELLAGIIGGSALLSPTLATLSDWLLESARTEGVVALVNERLGVAAGVDPKLRQSFVGPARELAVTAMFFETECRRVLEVLGGAGIQVLLLKGSALAFWLYETPYLRECVDIDLLFRSRPDAEQAALLLRGVGYELSHEAPELAYEMCCYLRRESARKVELDMHWRLSSAPVFANKFSFDELYGRSIPLIRLGAHARGLSPPDALVNACMHRSQNLYFDGIGNRLKWLLDIHLLAKSFSQDEWKSLVDTCVERGLCGVCDDGFEATQHDFHTSLPAWVMDALQSGIAGEVLQAKHLTRWTYLQCQNLAALPDLRTRVRWMMEQVLLPLPRMRERYGKEGDGWLLLHWQRICRASRHLLPRAKRPT